MPPSASQFHRAVFLLAAVILPFGVRAETPAESKLQQVVEQNAKLQQQLDAQQKLIDDLRATVNRLAQASDRQEKKLDQLDAAPPSAARALPEGSRVVVVSGEAGAGFFSSGPDGQFRNSEFRADEARVNVEARIVDGVYAFAEMKLAERENAGGDLYLGELYVDFEEFGRRLGLNSPLGLRVGRIDVPFGEEYLSRDAIDNPLISHSLADFWGVDEGVELYGRAGGVQYVLAVQNGGAPAHNDFNADKAVTLRLAGEPAAWLHLGASAMRTGRLDVAKDGVSELWIGNGVLVSTGKTGTTRHFGADLLQVEARAKWRTGHVHAALGRVWYEDDDTSRDNSRTIDFHSLELVQQLGDGWFGAGRYSQVSTDLGYPLAGQGSVGKYVFSGIATQYLNRLSLGLGYRFAEPLVWKTEYSWERGRTTTGASRDQADTFSTEIAVKF